MNHKKNTKKFKRTTEERRRLYIDLTSALILNGQITTFTARAKWFSPKFQRLVTLVKRAGDDTQAAYRKVRPDLSEKVARKLIEEVVPTLKNREGGYVSILNYSEPFNEHKKSIVTITKGEVVKKVSNKIKKSETIVTEPKVEALVEVNN
jgi:ribosomal protein L17